MQGCRDQLSELTQNLCDNAIRYNRPGGHVELRCGVGSDGCPYFEVEDNGIGIPQEMLSHIYDFGFSTKAAEGRGFGMSMIQNIVVRHDGTIDVDTEQGAGTTFTLIFQIKRQKEGSQ